MKAVSFPYFLLRKYNNSKDDKSENVKWKL